MIPLLTAGVPWALLMPWLVSSPLNSPNTFFLVAGALGYPMAVAQIVAAVSIGVGSGWLTFLLESKGYLSDQLRTVSSKKPAGSSGNLVMQQPQQSPTSMTNPTRKSGTRHVWGVFWRSLFRAGTRRLVKQLLIFVFVDSAVKILIPTMWIAALFGQGQWYSIPLAALLGVPLYVNNASSVPLLQTLVEGGMSPGAALAFLLAGAGTSLPAMSGLLVLARSRIVALYVSLVFLGAAVSGSFYSFLDP